MAMFSRYRLLKRQPILFCLSFLLAIDLIISVSHPTQATIVTPSAEDNPLTLPAPQAHSLPPMLAQWQDSTRQGDYFEAIEPTPVGFLVWSEFPVLVYIQPPDSPESVESTNSGSTGATERSQAWYEAVQQAMHAWIPYLPLMQTDDPDAAAITILRSAPPMQLLEPSDSSTPLVDRLPRIRAAETRYDILLDRSAEGAMLLHRFTIQLTPSQTVDYTQASARHELGHALGLWGHSPSPTDAMYFSQVRRSPLISVRDINTLKKVYEQPTLLGWRFPEH